MICKAARLTTSSADGCRAATDEQLLVRYREAGDRAAFAELVHRYKRPVYSYLVRYLHSAALAEEVFQETFLRVHQKCRTFSANRSFRPWLYSIATHAAIDALRKEDRHHLVSLDEQHVEDAVELGTLVDLLQSDDRSPADEAEAHEREQWTRRALAELPGHQRAVLLLVYFQGLKFREVAEVLGIREGTVKSRVHKALRALNAAWRRSHPPGP